MNERRVLCAIASSRAELIRLLEGALAGKAIAMKLASTPSGERFVELRAASVGVTLRLGITVLTRDGNDFRVRLTPLDQVQREQIAALLMAQQKAAERGEAERAPAAKPRAARALSQPPAGRRIMRRRTSAPRQRADEPTRRRVAFAAKVEPAAPKEQPAREPRTPRPESESWRANPKAPWKPRQPASIPPPVPPPITPMPPPPEPPPPAAPPAPVAPPLEIALPPLEIELALEPPPITTVPERVTLEPEPAPAATRPRGRGDDLEAAAVAFFEGKGEVDDVCGTLVKARTEGARALVRARVGRTLDDRARAAYVSLLRGMGSDALPALGVGLERAFVARDEAGAEDLLRAIPEMRNQTLGTVVGRFADHAATGLRRAALAALASLTGADAVPRLRAALGDPDQAVRRAAVVALRRLGATDPDTAIELAKIVCGDVPAPLELRVMAAAALANPAPTARAICVEALRRVVDPPQRSLIDRLPGFRRAAADEPLLVAACRSLLTIGGDDGKRAVESRMEGSHGALRRNLRSVMNLRSVIGSKD